MAMPIPRNVCADGGYLTWSPVSHADGYDIHVGTYMPASGNLGPIYPQYVGTVLGEDSDKFPLSPELITRIDQLRVVSWCRDSDGNTARSEKSGFACALYQPEQALVFEDTFTDFDAAYWLKRFPYWTETINQELQLYTPEAVRIGDNGLELVAQKTDEQWTSGIITGDVDQSYLYGYFEASILLPTEIGMWPAWWLLNEKYVGLRPEIDIMEAVNGTVHQTYHWWTPQHNQASNPNPIPTPEGFNLYGIDWQPERLTWYFNRRPIFEITGDSVSSQPAYPILNLAVGGFWAGEPDPSVTASKMCVRSVKIWQ